MFSFCLRHLSTGKIKHLLAQKFEKDGHLQYSDLTERLSWSNFLRPWRSSPHLKLDNPWEYFADPPANLLRGMNFYYHLMFNLNPTRNSKIYGQINDIKRGGHTLQKQLSPCEYGVKPGSVISKTLTDGHNPWRKVSLFHNPIIMCETEVMRTFWTL